MDRPEIIISIIIMVGIFLSSLKKPKKTKTPTSAPQQHNKVPPLPRHPSVPPSLDDMIIPITSQKKQKQSPKPFIPMPASEEGSHAVKVDVAPPDDAYSEPHPYVPKDNDWRRAIIAHEILKRKF